MEKDKCFATGKRRFYTAGDAKKALISTKAHNNLKRSSKKSTGKNKIKRFYPCSFCRGYHLSSQDYISTNKYIENNRDDARKKKGLIVFNHEVVDWKNDSLPFPNEAQAIKDAGGIIIRVDRPGYKATNAHLSETALDDWNFDYKVQNRSDLLSLMFSVHTILNKIK